MYTCYYLLIDVSVKIMTSYEYAITINMIHILNNKINKVLFKDNNSYVLINYLSKERKRKKMVNKSY